MFMKITRVVLGDKIAISFEAITGEFGFIYFYFLILSLFLSYK
jgi:hypothetical protein